MAEEDFQIALKYEGAAVANGTMPIEAVSQALQGFANAYGKVAGIVTPGTDHELRVSAFRVGSFEMHIIAFVHDPTVVSIMKAGGGVAAKLVYDRVKEYITAKKHTKGRPYRTQIEANNSVVIINEAGASMNITHDVARLMQKNSLDADIEKVTAPLSEGYVDLVSVQGTGEDAISIDDAEKSYFSTAFVGENRQPVSLEGKIISASKRTHKGTFQLKNGNHVPYHYTGQSYDHFANDYGYAGYLQVEGYGVFDDSAVLRRLDLNSSLRLQSAFDFEVASEPVSGK